MTTTVTMTQTVCTGGNNYHTAGQTYSISDDLAALYLQNKTATYVSGGPSFEIPVTATTNPLTGGMTIYGANGAAALEIPKSGYENKLVATDYYPYLAFCENSTYRFAKADGADGVVHRVKLSDNSTSNGVNVTSLYLDDGTTLIASGFIASMWAWDDYQLAQVNDLGTDKNYLYKSIDNFATCGANAPLYNDNKPVFAIGWNVAKSTNAAGISIMAGWSLCRGTNRRGEDLVLFGQYNVNQSRTAGGANDWTNVLCSRRGSDVGTWDVVVEANTGGTNFLRHCHAVAQDSYTKDFYIFYGDGSTSGIYVWDGVLPLPANTPPSQAANYRGWRGMDRYNNPFGDYNALQITTAIFLPDEVIVPVDDSTTGVRGIYSLSRDLSKYEKIWDGTANGLPANHSMYSSTICPVTQTIIASTLIEPFGTDQNADYTLWVYAATKAGKYRDWKRVARYMVRTDNNGGRSHTIFQAKANGDILIGSARGAGKMYMNTSVCRVSGVFSGSEEEVIHPVYWIDPVKGLDTNNGYGPATAWKTINYATRSQRVSTASLINIMAGFTDEGTTSMAFGINVATRPAQLNYPVLIRGQGRKKSGIKANTSSGFSTQGTAIVPFKFKSLSCINLAAGPFFSHGALAPITTSVEFEDVYSNIAGTGILVRAESGKVVIKNFEADAGANGQLVRHEFTSGPADITIQSGVVRGGKCILGWQGTEASVGVVEHVTGIGQTQASIDVQSGAVVLPTVKNCAFDTSVAGVRDSRTVKTSANGIVDYNVYKTANSTLVGGDQSSKTTSDLQLIGTTGMPKPTSPVIGAGTASVSATTDGVGDVFGSPRNAGAF